MNLQQSVKQSFMQDFRLLHALKRCFFDFCKEKKIFCFFTKY
nr:MAG TPA: hypothetical protein [Herelleviridae sp.]